MTLFPIEKKNTETANLNLKGIHQTTHDAFRI